MPRVTWKQVRKVCAGDIVNRGFVWRRGAVGIFKQNEIAMLVEMRSLNRWAVRRIKVVHIAVSPCDVTFDFQQPEILVEGCASDSGVLFGSRRGQRKLIIVQIGREVQIKLQSVGRKNFIRMHPVRICDLQKILLYTAFVDMNPPLIRTCFRHNFKSPFAHSLFRRDQFPIPYV